jgi:hypothetical protein
LLLANGGETLLLAESWRGPQTRQRAAHRERDRGAGAPVSCVCVRVRACDRPPTRVDANACARTHARVPQILLLARGTGVRYRVGGRS